VVGLGVALLEDNDLVELGRRPGAAKPGIVDTDCLAASAVPVSAKSATAAAILPGASSWGQPIESAPRTVVRMTAGRPRTTAITLVLVGIVSVQCGSAVATQLFDDVGPVGAVSLRLASARRSWPRMWRPALRLLRSANRNDLILFGLALAE